MGIIFTMLFFLLLLMGAATLAACVLRGLGLGRMARHAGMENPILAWIPVANRYLLGCLCDRAVWCRSGRKRNFAVLLPALNGAQLLLPGMVSSLLGRLTGNYSEIVLALELLLWVGNVVVTAVGLYSLYCDYAPGQEALYTGLSVIFGSLGWAVLLLILRDRVPLSVRNRPGTVPPSAGPELP